MVAKTHPNFIPPWQDVATLCAHICIGATTLDAWVAQGILPPPRKRGGKLMWKWSKVDEYLTNGPPDSLDAFARRMKALQEDKRKVGDDINEYFPIR